MSLTRQFLREFRPLFRILEEPFGRPAAGYARRSAGSPFAVFNDPFFNNNFPSVSGVGVPAVDVSEEPNAFVVEAELPGIKKENVDLRIGDSGQSLTIEGRTFVQSSQPSEAGATATATATAQSSSEGTPANDEAKAVTQTNNQSTQLTNERTFTGASSFSRTIWLPKRVDPSNVSAKLEDGILRVRVPKAEDQESVKVNIE
ncbi:hypothetical protein ACEPAH_8755 [Sanghuangporus vaninii]